MIVITGAGGKTGQAITAALVARGAAVRVFVHRAVQGAALRTLGAREVVIGRFEDGESVGRALAGAESVYHIGPNMHPDELAIVRRVAAAVRAAGVRRFVYHSVLHPQTEEMPHHWQKLRAEEFLLTTDLRCTVLQPAAYMQNLLAYWPAIVGAGILRVPYAVGTRLGLVDLADVAAVAARVLTEDGHAGATYELAGGEVLTQVEVAAILAETLGSPVQALAVDRSEWASQARADGLSGYATATLLRMFDYYERFGFWGNPFVLTALLGRRPATVREFVGRQGREIGGDG